MPRDFLRHRNCKSFKQVIGHDMKWNRLLPTMVCNYELRTGHESLIGQESDLERSMSMNLFNSILKSNSILPRTASICTSNSCTSNSRDGNIQLLRKDHLIADLVASIDLSNISLRISNALTQAPPAMVTGSFEVEPQVLSGLPCQSDVSSALLIVVIPKSEGPPCPLTPFMRWKYVKVSAEVGGIVVNISSHFRYLPLIAERQALYEITLGSSCCSYAWVTTNLMTHSGEHDSVVCVTACKIEKEGDISYSSPRPLNYKLQMTKVCCLWLSWLWLMQLKYMAQLGKRRHFTASQTIWHSSSNAA